MRLECVPTDRAGAGKLDGIIRVKDYLPDAERLGQYTPIYDVASRVCGCSWVAANKVAVVDTVGCNLDCFYCYQRGRSTEDTVCGAEEVAGAFGASASDCLVWRVSGGEPLLQDETPQLLRALVDEAYRTNRIVLLNTNGLRYAALPEYQRLLIEVSIKGLCAEWADWVTSHSGVLERQLDTLNEYVGDGHALLLNLVCLAPEGSTASEAIMAARALRDELARLDETLPLRTTPVVAKHYDWCPDWPLYVDHADAWREAVVERYGWLNAASPAASFLGIQSA